MEAKVIDFYNNFICLADKCSDNCCKAWDMPIDAATLELYEQAQGAEGRKLRRSVKRNLEGDPILKTRFGKCCNLTSNGLCSLHCAGDTHLMPRVCRVFPRNTISYGGITLGTLDLSCSEVARLFFEQEGRRYFIDAPEDYEVYWDVKEADADFALKLLNDLNQMLDLLWNEEDSIWNIELKLFAHVYAAHLKLGRNDIEGALGVPFSTDYISENFAGELPWLLKERSKAIYNNVPLIPFSFINTLIYQNLPDAYMVLYHMKMYKLVTSYKKQFGKLGEDSADRAFAGTFDSICEEYPWLMPKMKEYLSYKLQMNYLNASVDYYVIEPVFMAMLNVQFLMLFIITWCGADKGFSQDIFINLLSENERLLSHNTAFASEVMKRFREELV